MSYMVDADIAETRPTRKPRPNDEGDPVDQGHGVLGITNHAIPIVKR